MSDEADRKDISNFTFISSTTIPPTNANLNQQFTPNLTPLSAYAYYNDNSGNGAYYFQTNSLQPQPNSFHQQPSVTSENFGHPFNSGQPSGYQYNYPIMMDQQLNPYGLMQQEAALGTDDVTMTNPYHNEQYIFSPSPQPQEIFSSTINNGQFGTQSPPLFFNNINSNFTGVPNNSTRAESMINQIPQLQRFSYINGNDLSCFSPIPKPIPLPINWSFASRQLNGGNEISNHAAPLNEEDPQNFILRIEQVTLINAVPNNSKNVSFERVSADQTSTSIQHKYITDSEGLTILSQIGDNKPQVIKIDMESIKQMLKSNSCFYIQQFLNGPMGKIKNQATTEMQTDGSFHTDIKEIAADQKSEPIEVVQILAPKKLPAEEAHEDLQKQSSKNDLVFDKGGVANFNEKLFSENEADSEPEQRTFGENDGPVLDNESESFT